MRGIQGPDVNGTFLKVLHTYIYLLRKILSGGYIVTSGKKAF